MSKIGVAILVWSTKKFIQNPMLIIPVSMLISGIGWGIITSIIVNGETNADAWTLLFMAPIGFFLQFDINSIFFYGFVTGLFYGVFFGLVCYMSFLRNMDQAGAQVKTPRPLSIQPQKISSLSKNIAKLYLIIVALLYLYTILEIYNNPGNIKNIYDIPGALSFLLLVTIASLFISVGLIFIIKIIKPQNKIHQNIAQGLYFGFLISAISLLGMHILEKILLSSRL